MRRTKIIATLGPATDPPAVMALLIESGLDAARLNYSHGTHAEHATRLAQVRQIAQAQQREVAIIADLQGPKIRIARFKQGRVELKVGQAFTLDTALAADAGDAQRVGVTFKALARDVRKGDSLLLDDGRIVLKVQRVTGSAITTTVVVGGMLSNNKGSAFHVILAKPEIV